MTLLADCAALKLDECRKWKAFSSWSLIELSTGSNYSFRLSRCLLSCLLTTSCCFYRLLWLLKSISATALWVSLHRSSMATSDSCLTSFVYRLLSDAVPNIEVVNTVSALSRDRRGCSKSFDMLSIEDSVYRFHSSSSSSLFSSPESPSLLPSTEKIYCEYPSELSFKSRFLLCDVSASKNKSN